MNTAIALFDREPTFAVERSGELGEVRLQLRANATTIELNVGNFHDDVSTLAQSLRDLADDLDTNVLNEWEDTPEEDDGWVSDAGRGEYHVSLEGKPVGTYPTQGIACVALAQAQVAAGVFPNVWFCDERGGVTSIYPELRKFHDEGGDKMAPLEGAQYTEGDLVTWSGSDYPTWVVIGDYGPEGVWAHTNGDRTVDAVVTDRSELTLIDREGE